eukprot:m51a1_g10938 hypothetical protein (357) ;mRNA; f:171034-172406
MGHSHSKTSKASSPGGSEAAAPAASSAPAAASALAASAKKPRPPLVGESTLATDEEMEWLWHEIGDGLAGGCSEVPLYSRMPKSNVAAIMEKPKSPSTSPAPEAAAAAASASPTPPPPEESEEAKGNKCWRLLYASERNGRSFMRLRQAVVAEGRCIVLVTDASHKALFGGLVDTLLESSSRFYGSSDTCVFSLRPNKALYKTTGYNENYQFFNHKVHGDMSKEGESFYGLAMGGQLNFFAWAFDENLEHCSCKGYPKNSTYGCPPLAGGPQGGDFALGDVEVWCVEDPPREQHILSLLVRKRKAAGEAVLGEGSAIDRELMSMAGHQFYSEQLVEPTASGKKEDEVPPKCSELRG